MSSAAIIGCYPALCASLQSQGVSASRLVPLGSRICTGLLGADVVATHQMTSSRGKTLVRVVQAWLKQDSVTVSYGSRLPAKQLAFSSVTRYTAVSPGVHTVKFAASGEHTTMSLGLTADTVHTIVVLDGRSGLKADELTDAVGTAVMPKGGAATGFGGTAPPSAADLTPWLLWSLAGALITAGVIGLGWPRRTAAILRPGHAAWPRT